MSRPRKYPLPTFEAVAAKLRYDPLTGEFERKSGDGYVPIPTYKINVGYRVIGLSAPRASAYLAHRLAWLLTHGEWPVGEIDHRDNDKLNNRIANLRIATRSQNRANVPSFNRTGRKGIRQAASGRFVAYIWLRTHIKHLGTFDTLDEAGAVYERAALAFRGEFANTKVVVRGSINSEIVFGAHK